MSNYTDQQIDPSKLGGKRTTTQAARTSRKKTKPSSSLDQQKEAIGVARFSPGLDLSMSDSAMPAFVSNPMFPSFSPTNQLSLMGSLQYYHPPMSSLASGFGHFSQSASSSAATAPDGARSSTMPPTVHHHNLLYGGNIAAACEASNEETAQKLKESSKNDAEDQHLQKKKAARIIAWQSRERKRIEIEVLQETQAELLHRNSELKYKNAQLRLIIDAIKSALPENRSIGGISNENDSSRRMDYESVLGRSVYTQPSAQQSLGYPSSTSITAPAVGSSHVPPGFPVTGTLPNFASSPGTQRPQPILLPPPLQRFEQILTSPSHLISTQGSLLTRDLLCIHDIAPILARQHGIQGQQTSSGTDDETGKISPPSQNNMPPEVGQGGLPIDISSLLTPPSYQHVNVPLIRIIPKRKHVDDNSKSEKEAK
jgi:hypothetical protein